MSYIAQYWTADNSRWLLGGVKRSESSRWSHREDAEHYLETVKEVHANLNRPLVVEGQVVESDAPPQIRRVQVGHNGVRWCSCAKCIRPS